MLNHGSGGTAKVNVRYGTVMDVEPNNCATDITLSNSTTNIVYIHVTIDINGNFLTAEILTGASLPANGNYDGYIAIGQVVVDGSGNMTINQAMTHSLRMAMCGRVVTGGVLTTAGTFEFWGF